MRTHQLQLHPLCKYCAELGRVTPATIVDHIEPHKGDVNKFWLGQAAIIVRCLPQVDEGFSRRSTGTALTSV